MKILSKSGSELIMIAMQTDTASKGDYLLIEDENSKRKMIVQIYDEEYLSSQSLIEDIVKDEVVTASSMENLHDPLNIGSLSRMIRDARLFHTKIRAAIDSSSRLSSDVTWLPSRVYSKIRRLKISELCSFLGRTGIFPISIGNAGAENEEFEIYAEDLDGRLNIITGKKESGKSHLSKMLVKTLVQHGAFVIVFDLNNEYGGLAWNHDGTPSPIKDQIMILEPGNGLKFSLDYCGKAAVSSMLRNALENKQTLRIEALGNAINTWNINELIRDALISRYHVIHSSRLFSNNNSDGDDLRFENVIERNRKGAAMIVNMGKAAPVVRRMIVELILTKLVELLEKISIPPIFLFAEEAHLYVRD